MGEFENAYNRKNNPEYADYLIKWHNFHWEIEEAERRGDW